MPVSRGPGDRGHRSENKELDERHRSKERGPMAMQRSKFGGQRTVGMSSEGLKEGRGQGL